MISGQEALADLEGAEDECLLEVLVLGHGGDAVAVDGENLPAEVDQLSLADLHPVPRREVRLGLRGRCRGQLLFQVLVRCLLQHPG